MALLKDWSPFDLSSAKKLRMAGNKARDARDWSAATEAYQGYLKVNPDDAGIWVQHAHALKEQGLLTDAEGAYRKAAMLVPRDADARLHLAHLLKRLDRPQQAITVFRELMELAPTGEVITELQSLGFRPDVKATLESRPGQGQQTGRYLELKDLFQYLSLHTTVTGITRVTLGLVNYILENMDEEEAASYNFAHQFGDAEGVLIIPKSKMRRIVQLAMDETPDLPSMQALIGEIRATSPLTQLQRGQLYLIVGAFWEFVANPGWLGGMKHRGVLIGAYIYDLIPITHNHYCMAALTDAFTAAFAETARVLDFAFTISAFVGRQVTTYVEQHDIALFPTIPVPLAHELRFESERAKAMHLPMNSKLDELDDTPFVLCVCTIEARKNHIYLFYIWQRMIEAGLDVPDLVFVGRPGWRIQDLLDQIDASRYLGGRLHIMHGLSDEELGALYDRCLFTVFPSFVEGWGLPVGESLSRGKVCVASSTTSIPEVGGEFVVYVDPFNLESGYQAITGLINDPASLAQLEAKLQSTFVARTWKDVGEDFFKKLNRVMSDLGQPTRERLIYAPSLEAGEILRVWSMENVGAGGAAYVRNPTRLAFAEGWRAVEATGTWMLERSAKVRLHTNCPSGHALSVLLRVGTSPWVRRHNTLKVSAVGSLSKRYGQERSTYACSMQESSDFWIRLKGKVDEAGYLVIYFRVDGEITPSDPSSVPVALRLYAVGYAESDDVGARLNLLEEALMPADSMVHPAK